jgi:hypothetical protein
VLGVKIKKSWVIRMGSDVGTKFVLDWVSNLCLHISPDGPDTYRLVFSQYLIDWLQRFPPDNDRRIVLLAGLLDQLRDLPCLIDQGRILEVMIAQSLAIRLALAETFGEIPGLQGTLLQDVVVPRDLGGRFNIQFLPSFQPGTTSGTPNIVGERIKSYNPDDWDLFFQNLSKDNWNTVGIAREKNSNGPDLVLPFQVTELADTTLPSLFYCVGTASKVYHLFAVHSACVFIIIYTEHASQCCHKLGGYSRGDQQRVDEAVGKQTIEREGICSPISLLLYIFLSPPSILRVLTYPHEIF